MKLYSPLSAKFRLVETQKKALAKMGLNAVEDLLYYFPVRYGDTSEVRNIDTLTKGDEATIFGKVSGLKTSKAFVKKIPMSEGFVEDETRKIKLVWFNQPYIAKMICEGQLVRVEGKVSSRRRAKPRSEPRSTTEVTDFTEELYMSNPKIEAVREIPNAVGDSLFGKDGEEHTMYPVYPESKGVTSYWIYHTIQKIFRSGILEEIQDPIPEDILKKYNLPNIKTAFIWIHAPKKEGDALSARKRFAFQEIFFIQLQKQKEKRLWSEKSAFKIETNQKDVSEFVKRFPFKPTTSQLDAIKAITTDFKRGYPMSRLLEGDVGSGKTAVAAATIYASTKAPFVGKNYGNLQTAYMAPTEILAKQHYENFI
jgi:ATP-dependent DNA helicase RecG